MHPERRLPITAGDRHGVPDCSHRRAQISDPAALLYYL